MGARDFSDSIKLEVIRKNMENNSGNIACEVCKIKLISIKECHFDHIFPFSKGGKSTSDNCQILCANCNLKKNDKLIEDFVLEEKAKAFLAGTVISDTDSSLAIKETFVTQEADITKEIFDETIREFIKNHGDIKKIDFPREYNHLPSFSYVTKYYGGLKQMKEAFGISDISYGWNRDTIKKAITEFVNQEGRLTQKDLKKKNGLPSMPCILRYYPEYQSLTDIQKYMLGLDSVIKWDKKMAISAGKKFMEAHDSITQKDFKASNGLPSYSLIVRLFSSLNYYQELIGAPISKRNEYISKNEIHEAVVLYFEGRKKEIINQIRFQEEFLYKLDIIRNRYGSFENFCLEEGITVLQPKKFRYSRQEVDNAISNWVIQGNDIPRVHELTKCGLPSQAVILKYYEDWKEPFILYKKLHEKVKGHN